MTIPLKDYIDLVEWTGKEMAHPGKAAIPPNLSSVFQRLNLNQKNWLGQVQHYGSSYYRVVGSLDSIIEKTKQLGQNWVKGICAIKSLYLSPN